MRLRWVLPVPLVCLFALGSGCGGPQIGGSHSSSGLINDTAVGKARCEDAKHHQLKPFVVEWDATDLSDFEAKAARDIVFVDYEGCDLTVLDGCSDSSIPGRYGTYQPPQFTSGTLEGFDIKNEDQLYANLPLGAAAFGAKVKHGEALKLSYYVTGMVTATRDTVAHDTIAKNPQCKGANYFVWAYNLGAFDLSSVNDTKAAVKAGFGNIGGGAEHEHEAKNLKQGGDLESCKTNSQTHCRVPIRLVLRKIGEGGAEGGDVAGSAAPAPPPNYQNTPQGQASALRASARNKEQNAGDGAGCLADLDRADRIDPSGSHAPQVAYTRALCEMRVGKCDDGKKLLRDYLKAQDKEHAQTDAQLDQSVKVMADAKCPSSEGKPDQQVRRAMARIAEAAQKKNAEACLEEARRIEKLIPRIPTKPNPNARNMANAVLMQAAVCVGKAGRCKEARKLYDRYYHLQFKGTMSEQAIRSAEDQTFSSTVRECAGKK
jgi:hypothetical protein